MKISNYYLLRSILAIALGLVLVIWPDSAISFIVIAVGLLFFLAGLGSTLMLIFSKDKFSVKGGGIMQYAPHIIGIGSLLFGLWLIITPAFFINILMYILGFILIIGSVQQLSHLFGLRKLTNIPATLYILPSLILLCGIIVLCNPFAVMTTAFVMLGVVALIYGISELFYWSKFKKLAVHATGDEK